MRLLGVVTNLKHRAILMLTYSAGLRLSEVVRLKVEDIDEERHMIHIRGAKGRKDRYTLLSNMALEALHQYWETCHPKIWLFPGPKTIVILPPAPWKRFWRMLVRRQESQNILLSTPCGIVLPLIYLRVAQTYAIFRSCWGIRAQELQKYTLM